MGTLVGNPNKPKLGRLLTKEEFDFCIHFNLQQCFGLDKYKTQHFHLTVAPNPWTDMAKCKTIAGEGFWCIGGRFEASYWEEQNPIRRDSLLRVSCKRCLKVLEKQCKLYEYSSKYEK